MFHDDDKGNRWWLRIRRAFGVPDLMSNDNARTLIEGQLVAEARLPQPNGRDLVAVLLDAARRMGAAGELDDLLVPEEVGRYLELDLAPHDRLFAGADLSDLALVDPDDRESATVAARLIVERVADHVRRQPFEDNAGRYFRLEE